MSEHRIVRLATGLLPLALTPAIGWAINAGILNFGGGEKDIILIIPWVLWSLIYAVVALIYWRRKAQLSASLLWAVAWATGLTLALGLLAGPYTLGIGGGH